MTSEKRKSLVEGRMLTTFEIEQVEEVVIGGIVFIRRIEKIQSTGGNRKINDP